MLFILTQAFMLVGMNGSLNNFGGDRRMSIVDL